MKRILLLLLLFAAPTSAEPILELVPSKTLVGFNEAFSVDLVFSSGLSGGLSGFGFDVLSDAGVSFSAATVSAGFLDLSAFLPDTDVAGATIGAVGGTDVVISTLFFVSGDQAGTWGISAVSGPGDRGLEFQSGSSFGISEITAIQVSSEVPAPVSFALFVTGLLALWTRRELSRKTKSHTGAHR